MEFIKDLNETSFFKTFSSDELHRILEYSSYSVKEYPKGSIIKNEGDDVKSLGIILKGAAVVQKNMISGKTADISRIEKGQTFGEAILFSHKHTYPATVVSLMDCTVFFLSKESLQKIFLIDQKFLTGYISLLSNRIVMLSNIIEDFSYKTIREKISRFLLSEHKSNQATMFSVTYSRNEMADKMNITRPSLSRELIRLRDEGIIDFHKNTFKLLDIDALRQILA